MAQQTSQSSMKQASILSGSYSCWKNSAGQYFISKASDTSKLAGPYTSLKDIPANPTENQFKTHNFDVSTLQLVPSSEVSRVIQEVTANR